MWEIICEILLDAIKDSVITLPVLFVCYMLIELLEERILNRYQKNKMLKGRFAPVVSAGFGLIPQCGFSVVASELFGKRAITIGSLFAILIATSDEALPLMLTRPDSYFNLFLILAIKFVYAVLVGLSIDFVIKKIKTKREQVKIDLNVDNQVKKINIDENFHVEEIEIHGCCHHDLEYKKHSKWKTLLIHPLIHSLKIFAFILVINIVFGCFVEFVGDSVISDFMISTGFFQPFLVSIVGAIPNCAASVIITELFLAKGITLGSCIAGLCMNSGLALVMIFKFNKNAKQNFLIIASMYVLSCFLGVVINLF